MSDETTPKPKLGVRHEIALLWEEFSLDRLGKYCDELMATPADTMNAFVSALLDDSLEPHEIILPNGSSYGQAEVGYVQALAIVVQQFLASQDRLHIGRDPVGDIRRRMRAGETIGGWLLRGPQADAPTSTN